MMLKRITILTFLMLLASHSLAGVKAYLNQTTVYEGDPVRLTIESDRKVSDNPDISVLNQDFQVQGTSEGTSFSMVNGDSSFSQTWTITLQPKRKGELVIPAISLGSESTLPLRLVVADITPEVQAQNREHVTLEAIADIGQSLPYVQQQTPYTLKLYTDESVHQGDIFAPTIENAVIEQISKDKQYSITRNGKNFNVLERHYVISAEKSGKLVIPPALFKGKQRQQNAQQRHPRDSFFSDPFFNDPFFGNLLSAPGKPITTRSDSIEIDVQPIPQTYTGKNWLPAEDLRVTDSWDKSTPVFKVGEPITRTLTVHTKGLTGAQIPDFSVAKSEQIRVYPDQAKTETKTDGNTVFGLRQQPISYIPNVAGKVKIPAFQLDWWNVISKTQESFVIPAREVQVLPGIGGNIPTEKVAQQPIPAPTASPDASTSSTAEPEQESGNEKPDQNLLLWVLFLLGIISVAGIYFWRRHSKQGIEKNVSLTRQTPLRQVSSKNDAKQWLNELEQACKNNDKQSAARLLLQRARIEWPENSPKNLGALADRLISGVEAVRELDRSLYANHNQTWTGQAVWEATKDGFKRKVNKPLAKEAESVAASLYPDRSRDRS